LAVLRWIFFVVCPHNLRRPYYEPLVWFMIMIIIMIEIQSTGHQNNGTMHAPQFYQLYRLKRKRFIADYHYAAAWINNCNQNSYYENYSHHEPMILLAVSKDEWGLQEGTVKFTKNAFYIQRYGKGNFWAEATLNSKKIQAHSYSHCQVMWVWRHQPVS